MESDNRVLRLGLVLKGLGYLARRKRRPDLDRFLSTLGDMLLQLGP